MGKFEIILQNGMRGHRPAGLYASVWDVAFSECVADLVEDQTAMNQDRDAARFFKR